MERATRRLKETVDRTVLGDEGRQVYLDGLQSSLSAFAEAFTLVTGSNCRASVKELYAVEVLVPGRAGQQVARELLVATVVRSDVDKSRKVGTEPPDRVQDNSDFAQVVATDRPFFGQDLPRFWREHKYANSHWTQDQVNRDGFVYSSAIVWPVEGDPPIGGSGKGHGPQERVIAFLCVDSRRRRAFARKADTNFGAIYAHALYPALRYHLK